MSLATYRMRTEQLFKIAKSEKCSLKKDINTVKNTNNAESVRTIDNR